MGEKLLTIPEVADYLGMTEAWVIAHTGGNVADPIPSFKLGKYRRYRRAAVDEWLAARGTDGAEEAA